MGTKHTLCKLMLSLSKYHCISTNILRFVERKLKEDENFNYMSLVKGDKDRKDNLKFWDDDLCRNKPHTFDIILAVSDREFLRFHF